MSKVIAVYDGLITEMVIEMTEVEGGRRRYNFGLVRLLVEFLSAVGGR